MDWKTIVTELNSVMTLQQIAEACGLASKGHAHDIRNGRQTDVLYSVGVKLIAIRKKKDAAIRKALQS